MYYYGKESNKFEKFLRFFRLEAEAGRREYLHRLADDKKIYNYEAISVRVANFGLQYKQIKDIDSKVTGVKERQLKTSFSITWTSMLEYGKAIYRNLTKEEH